MSSIFGLWSSYMLEYFGCSLCSSDQLGISLALRGSGLRSHLSQRHHSPRSCVPFWVNFCIWCEVAVQTHCSLDIQLSQNHLLKVCFSPLNCIGILVKNQLIINLKVYFWTLNPVPLIGMCILMPVLHCLHYGHFIVSFEIVSWGSSNFVPPLKNCFGSSGPLAFVS